MASAKGCELVGTSIFSVPSIAIAIPAAVARPRPLPQGPPTGLTEVDNGQPGPGVESFPSQ
jgi:hypothetical protein